jgi:1-deoxy-D-xylulose-5-phosphate reductoisomerase
MKKKLLIFGSTGSIGTQTLEIVRKHPQRFEVAGLSANGNYELLNRQIAEFRPKYAALSDEAASGRIRDGAKAFYGSQGLINMCHEAEADVAVTAIVGLAGLPVTTECIKKGMTIALANKETLVGGGEYITKLAEKYGSDIIPVDSEHSAIFQCLQNDANRRAVKRIILTASGGPFYGHTATELEKVTPEMALRHPNWEMGGKITIDSATLMNKGLEVIEAKWLFGLGAHQIDVLVHRKSIVHSMVELNDNSVLAQMGVPDMRIPIQYALTYPERIECSAPQLDLLECGPLEFMKPDMQTFYLLRLAYDALERGSGKALALNSANEVAVEAFLKGKISFIQIMEVVNNAYTNSSDIDEGDIKEILLLDGEVRELCREYIEKIAGA